MRLAYPQELVRLRAAAGLPRRLEVVKSLRTGDIVQARVRLAEQKARTLAEFQAEIERLRSAGRVPLRKPTDSDLQQIVFAFKSQLLQQDAVRRSRAPTADDLERARNALMKDAHRLRSLGDAWCLDDKVLDFEIMRDFMQDDAERRAILIDELRRHLQQGQFALVKDVMEAAAFDAGLDLQQTSDDYRALGRGMLSAYINALQAMERRDSPEGAGDLEVIPINGSPGNKPAREAKDRAKSTPPSRGKSLSIRDHFDRYLKEQHSSAVARSLKDKRATLRRFIELVGDKPIEDYRRDDIVEFKRALQQFPINAEHRYPGKKAREVIRLAKSDKAKLLSTPTINNKLSTLAAFGKWLESNADDFEATTFQTTAVRKSKAAPAKYDEFSDSDVARILMAPLFTGCAGEDDQQTPGKHRARDHRYWVVLLCAYHGLRLGEACQIAPDDVTQVAGIWTLHITDEGSHQSLKTRSSKRQIPLHPMLIDLGLPEYAERSRQLGWKSLVDSAQVDTDGRTSTRIGKWFRKYLGRLGVSGKGGMHRFRHTVITKLRAAGYPDHEIAPIVGHAVDLARMTSHYGSGVHLGLDRMRRALDSIAYTGVDPARLLASATCS